MAVIIEFCVLVEVAGMNLPEVIHVEHVVRYVFQLLRQLPGGAGAGFAGATADFGHGFKDFPDRPFVLVHHPAMVVFLLFPIRQGDVQRAEGHADAIAADSRSHQQGGQQKRKVFAVATLFMECFVRIQPGIGATGRDVGFGPVTQVPERFENHVSAEIKAVLGM